MPVKPVVFVRVCVFMGEREKRRKGRCEEGQIRRQEANVELSVNNSCFFLLFSVFCQVIRNFDSNEMKTKSPFSTPYNASLCYDICICITLTIYIHSFNHLCVQKHQHKRALPHTSVSKVVCFCEFFVSYEL